MSWGCPSCGFQNNDESILRCSCGYELITDEPPNYTKIRGALILVAIVLFSTPFFGISYLFQMCQIISSESWPFLGFFDKTVKTLIITGMIWSGMMTVVPIFLPFLMFKRRKIFPRLMVGYLLLSLAFHFIEYYSIKSIQNLPIKSALIYKGEVGILLICFACLVWVPYFFISERVKGTFIR